MSDKINDGGPAFPLTFVYDPDLGECGQYVDANDAGVPCGMSLRDWFAGQALAGLLAFPNGGGGTNEMFAQAAYKTADAMLAARNGGAK